MTGSIREIVDSLARKRYGCMSMTDTFLEQTPSHNGCLALHGLAI